MRALSLVVMMLGLATLACTLTATDSNPTPVQSVQQSVQPQVTIIRPSAGQTFAVGETVTVEAQATDPSGEGVTRVALLINNVIIDQQTSQAQGGDPSLSVLLDYIAAVPNPNLTLTVLAFRGTEASEPATVTVNITEQGGGNSSTDAGSSTGGNTTGGTTSGSTTGGSTTGGIVVPTTSTICRARINVNALNFRSGPSTDYTIIGSFSLNEEPPVVGRLSDNTWFEVTGSGVRGWISAAFSSLLGNCNNVPVTTPPASPTPAVTNTPSPEPNAPANLVVSTLNGATTIALPPSGEVVSSYLVQVRNVGGTAADAFNVTIFSPDGTFFDYVVNSLDPGETETVDGLTVTFSAPGSYRLEIFVDSSNNIAESNENDNGAFLDIVVAEPTPTPESN